MAIVYIKAIEGTIKMSQKAAGNAVLNVRMDSVTKEKAKAILDELHLSMTDAVNIFFKQIIMNKGLPFPVRIPNALTAKTIEDTDNGIGVKRFKSVEDFFEDLEDGDIQK